MQTEKKRFPGSLGYDLVGFLDRPDEGEAKIYALFAHCFTCNKHLKAVHNISLALTDMGVGVFRFDFTGLGESEGDFADTNFSSNVDDLISAAKFLEAEGFGPHIMTGHSLGGAAVLHAARRIDSVRAVATIGAPAEPSHVRQHFTSQLDDIVREGKARVQLAGRPFTIKQQFIDDLETTRIDESIHRLNRALLVMHSPADNVVGIDNAAKIFQTARHPKSFVSLDPADHLLNNPNDSQFAGRMLAVWAERYLNQSTAG